MTEATTIEAPEGIGFDILIYLTSDATGINAVARLGGLPAVVPFTGKADPMELVRRMSFPELADDWRLMTRAEIADYKRECDEEGE